jgi:colanic acid/amylovoran biosynthesis glycosyltransferase
MKIAFIVNEFPSLSETFVLNQITGLLDKGQEIEIFARRRGNMQKVHNEIYRFDLIKRTTYFLPIPRNRFLRAFEGIFLIARYLPRCPGSVLNSLNFFRFGKLAASLILFFQSIPFLNKGPYDVIQCHFGQNGNLAVILRNIGALSGKIVTTFHGFDLTSYIKKFGPKSYEYLFEKGDLFLPISARWKNRLIALGCTKNKILVHRMGIDIGKISSKKHKNKDDILIRILSVARLVEKKGIYFGVEAVAKIIKKNTNIEYLIVGDGPLKNDLIDQINRLNLNGNIKLLGSMEHEKIIELMHSSDIFLAPSVTSNSGDQEGIPVVLMEAMAAELPVISTYHSGIPELVSNGINGFLVKEYDVYALTEKIERLISYPQIAKHFGLEGKKKVIKDYDINKLNRRLLDLYIELINA